MQEWLTVLVDSETSYATPLRTIPLELSELPSMRARDFRQSESHRPLPGLRAAELAARTLRDPQDQSRFVAKVREVLADDIQRGEPLTPVRLRERGRRVANDIPPLQRSREAPEIVR